MKSKKIHRAFVGRIGIVHPERDGVAGRRMQAGDPLRERVRVGVDDEVAVPVDCLGLRPATA